MSQKVPSECVCYVYVHNPLRRTNKCWKVFVRPDVVLIQKVMLMDFDTKYASLRFNTGIERLSIQDYEKSQCLICLFLFL